MDGHEYEHLVAKYLKRHGYTQVRVTKASGDFGVDVVVSKGGHRYAVQCKYYSKPVSVGAVQEAVAGKAYYNCDRAMVVTNNTFTNAAYELARSNGVTLLDGVRSAGASGFRGLPKGVKALLLCLYIFAASAIFVAMVNVVKDQPFWKAVYNVVTTMAVVLFPLYIGPAIRGIKRLFRRKGPKPQNKPALTATPARAAAPAQTPATTPAVNVDEYKLRSALLLLSSQYYSADLSGLIKEPYIGPSRIQRSLKISYNSAGRVLDVLQEQGLITFSDVNRYTWTEKALLPRAEGQTGEWYDG